MKKKTQKLLCVCGVFLFCFFLKTQGHPEQDAEILSEYLIRELCKSNDGRIFFDDFAASHFRYRLMNDEMLMEEVFMHLIDNKNDENTSKYQKPASMPSMSHHLLSFDPFTINIQSENNLIANSYSNYNKRQQLLLQQTQSQQQQTQQQQLQQLQGQGQSRTKSSIYHGMPLSNTKNFNLRSKSPLPRLLENINSNSNSNSASNSNSNLWNSGVSDINMSDCNVSSHASSHHASHITGNSDYNSDKSGDEKERDHSYYYFNSYRSFSTPASPSSVSMSGNGIGIGMSGSYNNNNNNSIDLTYSYDFVMNTSQSLQQIPIPMPMQGTEIGTGKITPPTMQIQQQQQKRLQTSQSENQLIKISNENQNKNKNTIASNNVLSVPPLNVLCNENSGSVVGIEDLEKEEQKEKAGVKSMEKSNEKKENKRRHSEKTHNMQKLYEKEKDNMADMSSYKLSMHDPLFSENKLLNESYITAQDLLDSSFFNCDNKIWTIDDANQMIDECKPKESGKLRLVLCWKFWHVFGGFFWMCVFESLVLLFLCLF